MGLLDRLRSIVGLGGDVGATGGSRFSGSGANYICGACQATFRRQHTNCPECGSPILVPIEEADVDEDDGMV